jgi:hypothetical protein
MLPAFCPQIAPIMPVLPVVPTRKCCAVWYLRFELFHGMEEVIGSIPIRSTKFSFAFTFWFFVQRLHRAPADGFFLA